MSKESEIREIKEMLVQELGETFMSYLVRDDVAEISLNDDETLWVEFLGDRGMECVGRMPSYQAESAIGTIAHLLGKVVTPEHPFLSGRFPLDGSRFQAVMPPHVNSPIFSIRKHAKKIYSLENYVEMGILTESQKVVISQAVAERKNIIVAGGTSTGKTTFINAILMEMAKYPEQRLIIMEDLEELQPTSPNKVRMLSSEHRTLNDLLFVALRLRPDRLIIGEVRGKEALEMLKAMNTGHPGGVCSVHADDAELAILRLESLVQEANVPLQRELIGGAVDLIVALAFVNGKRRVTSIIQVKKWNGTKYEIQHLA